MGYTAVTAHFPITHESNHETNLQYLYDLILFWVPKVQNSPSLSMWDSFNLFSQASLYEIPNIAVKQKIFFSIFDNSMLMQNLDFIFLNVKLSENLRFLCR